MNTNTINNRRYFVIILFLVCLLFAGGTYAYLTFAINVTNGNYNTATTCFNVVYDVTNDDNSLPISGVLFPSSRADGGLFGKITMSINSSCRVNGKGTFTLNVLDASNLLFETVDGHCENSKTLETMYQYDSFTTCSAVTNGIWVSSRNPLKYAIYDTNSITGDTVPLKVGYINKTGSITLYKNFSITSTVVNYYIYIWLDGHTTDNSYANLQFNAYIDANVTQVD